LPSEKTVMKRWGRRGKNGNIAWVNEGAREQETLDGWRKNKKGGKGAQ